ncbi:MAG: TolC family protein [Gemmatimonadetes bacterium]|nr:TolC family protein [Gemmatimonadota bacterium]
MVHHIRAKIRSRRSGALALVAAAGCSLAAASCSFAPEPELPQPVADLPETFLESEAVGVYAPSEWWRDFNDPTLDALIDSALVSNLDLVEAVARVEQARAQSGIAWADLFPQVQVGADASRTSQPANTGIGGALGGLGGDSVQAGPRFNRFNFTTYSASLGFSWELDFWGRARNDRRAAVADLMASRADLHAARLGVLSETISTYFQIVDLRERVELTGETVDVLQERETLTETRYDRGLVSSLEMYQVRLDLRTVQASLPQIETQLNDAEGRMAVLLGRFAGRIDDLLGADLDPTPSLGPIDTGIPADLLLQRPDLRAAAERLEAARFRVGARKAQLLPTLSLSGSVGQQSGGLGGLFNAGQWFTNLLAGLTAPIFQGGRLRNNVKAAEAQYIQFAAAFGRTVLTAVYEVETSLMRYEEERERYAFLTSQLEEAQAASDLQARRYAAGVAGYTDYLDALRTLLGVQSTLSEAGTELGLARLAVHRSLGGGWTTEAPQPVLGLVPTQALIEEIP